MSPHLLKKYSGLCLTLWLIYWHVEEVTLIDHSALVIPYHQILYEECRGTKLLLI